MSKVFRGRYTTQIDEPFVVFIIGFRINRILAIHKWLPVAMAMAPMLKELREHKELGLLHSEPYLYWRGGAFVQYWRSFEQLEQFARNPDATHLEAWKNFNRKVGADGSVGIWHETYIVQAGQFECAFGNMPKMGLAHVGTYMPAVGKKGTAKRRMGLAGEPAVEGYDTPPIDKP